MTEIFLERKKNGQIQELISDMWLILCSAVQLVIPNVCTKFQNPKSSSFREIFDRKKLTNTHTHKQKRQKLYTPYILIKSRFSNDAAQVSKQPTIKVLIQLCGWAMRYLHFAICIGKQVFHHKFNTSHFPYTCTNPTAVFLN